MVGPPVVWSKTHDVNVNAYTAKIRQCGHYQLGRLSIHESTQIKRHQMPRVCLGVAAD